MIVEFKGVKLVYTNFMAKEGQYGGYSYSFIVDKETLLKHALAASGASKKAAWKDEDKTPAKLLKAMNVKTKAFLTDPDNYNEKFNDIISNMRDCDVLVSVKSKTPIKATKNINKTPIGWFSVADIIVDMYPTEYKSKRFISRTAPDCCSVKVTEYAKIPEGLSAAVGYVAEDDECPKTPCPYDSEDSSTIPF